jgi:hypothetical protein
MVRSLALVYLLALVFLGWGFAIGRFNAFPSDFIQSVYAQIAEFLHDPRSFGEKLSQHRQIQRNLFSYTGFQRRDMEFNDTGYVLLSRFSQKHSQVVIELMRLNDGRILHTWIPPLEEILRQWKPESAGSRPTVSFANSTEGYRAQHPLLLPDGSIVICSGEGPLVRIDKRSEIVWLVPEHFHHSIELDRDGNLVVPIVNEPSLIPYEGTRDDGFAIVSREGKVLKRHSVGAILLKSRYAALYLGVGKVSFDRLHVNDAQPINREAGVAKAGDVALSCRTLSTVFLYRPSTDEIVWLKTGPWLCQHDVNLVEGNVYSVFSNNVYFRNGEKRTQLFGDSSQVFLFDAATRQVRAPYAGVLKSLKLRTDFNGRSRVLPNGDVFIEESNAHRLVRVSPKGVRWEYVNGESAAWTGAVHWCRYLGSDEIDLSWME